MKRVIINVACGNWYPRGQARLRHSLYEHQFTGGFLYWTERYPSGCPPHEVLPYGFKSYAFQEAVKQGAETILWLDASCWAIKPLEPLFDHIEQEGHVFSCEGWKAGEWLKDEAFAPLNCTRDYAMQVPLIGGMFMGISMHHERSRKWLERFVEICQDGVTLPGPLRNVNSCISKDPRCHGHVADQSIAAILAYQLGMDITYPPVWRAWAKPVPDPRTHIFAAGL